MYRKLTVQRSWGNKIRHRRASHELKKHDGKEYRDMGEQIWGKGGVRLTLVRAHCGCYRVRAGGQGWTEGRVILGLRAREAR